MLGYWCTVAGGGTPSISIQDTKPQAPPAQPDAARPARQQGPRRWLLTDPGYGPGHGPVPALLPTLTAVTGIVDAVYILSLGRVFVANMTGNVVFAGFTAVGAPGFSLSASLSPWPVSWPAP